MEASDSLRLKVKTDALRLLSFRPRSVEELRARLRRKRYPAEVIEETVAQLSKHGLLDDERFARWVAASAVHTRPIGKKQIELDLKKRGVRPEAIAGALAGIGDYDEKTVAKDLVFKRFQKMTGLSKEKKKARLFSFLKRRGFETGASLDALGELFKGEETGEVTPESHDDE